MRRNSVACLLLLSALLYIGMAVAPAFSLQITDASGHTVVWQRPIRPGQEFSVTYIHSVHKTPVREAFRFVPGQGIVLTETVFTSYGVGIPYSTEHTFRVTPEGFSISDMNTALGEYLFRIGRVTDHWLRIEPDTIRLNELAPPGTLLRLQIKRQPFMRLR